jgi:hypothetical protein
MDEYASKVTRTKAAQRKIGGTEVVKPRFEIRHSAANDIQFELIERAGA